MGERCRIPMSVTRYLEIQGKVVSREEGTLRKELNDNYELIGNRFVKKERAPLIIASVDPSEDKDWLSTNSGFVQGLTKTVGEHGAEPTTFNDIQAFLCNCNSQFVWAEKCRQWGFSFLIAARAVAKAMLSLKHTSIFISYNEEESKEKILYARELYESLPAKYRAARKLKYDNKTSLVFEKNGQESAETRILSYPQRILRGKGGGIDVYLDEFAHCIHARKIYTSAMPVLSRGSSALWVGSTPAGKGGLFYEIGINQDNNYSLYLKCHIHWWDSPEFCIDIPRAREEAPFMITDERVEKFATQRLRAIRKSMVIDDFQQEYECAYLDESYSYFPWDLIMKCVPIMNVNDEESLDLDGATEKITDDRSEAGRGIDFYTDFEEFFDAFEKGIVQGPFLMGYDVGRTTDASEILIVQETEDNHLIPRCNIQMKNKRLPDQRAFAKYVINKLGRNVLKIGIDANGMGLDVAEDIEDMSYELVVKLPFNNSAWKEKACRAFRYRMDVGKISLPTYRPLLQQIHSIKRILLPGGTWRFDAEKADKHHGDKFWGLICAAEVGRPILHDDVPYTEFDSRPVPTHVQNAKANIMRENQGQNIFVPSLQQVMKFDPYGGHVRSPAGGNIPAPKFPGLSVPSLNNMPSDMILIH